MTVRISALKDSGALQQDYLLQLAEWHHNEWLHLNPGATLEQRLLRYKKSLEILALPEIFIACKDKKLIGSITLDKEDMDTRPYLTPWLASLYVDKDSRDQGIGSALIQYCIDYARQKDFKNIYLFTEDQIEFYRHRGWSFIETVEYRNIDVDLMCHSLK